MVTLVNFALQTKETCVMLIQNIYGEVIWFLHTWPQPAVEIYCQKCVSKLEGPKTLRKVTENNKNNFWMSPKWQHFWMSQNLGEDTFTVEQGVLSILAISFSGSKYPWPSPITPWFDPQTYLLPQPVSSKLSMGSINPTNKPKSYKFRLMDLKTSSISTNALFPTALFAP